MKLLLLQMAKVTQSKRLAEDEEPEKHIAAEGKRIIKDMVAQQLDTSLTIDRLVTCKFRSGLEKEKCSPERSPCFRRRAPSPSPILFFFSFTKFHH